MARAKQHGVHAKGNPHIPKFKSGRTWRQTKLPGRKAKKN